MKYNCTKSWDISSGKYNNSIFECINAVESKYIRQKLNYMDKSTNHRFPKSDQKLNKIKKLEQP